MCPPLSVTKEKSMGGKGEVRVDSGLFQSCYTKFNMGKKSDCRHKTSVPVPLDKCYTRKKTDVVVMGPDARAAQAI